MMQIGSQIKNYFFTLSQLKAIHIKLIDEHRERNEIILTQTKKGIEIANDLIESVTKEVQKKVSSTPIALTIKGKGILIKPYDGDEMSSNADWFSKLIPGAVISDFYIQSFGEGNQKQIAFARKTLIDPILKEIESEGYDIIYFSLGPLALANIFSLLDIQTPSNQWDAGNFTFTVLKNENGLNQIVSWQYAMQPHDLVIGTETIPSTKAITYATGLNALLQPETGVDDTRFTSQREQTIYNAAFKKLGVIGLGSILLIVLLNTIIFQYYFKQSQVLQDVYIKTSTQMKEAEEIKNSLATKNSFLTKEGWGQNPRMSYFADRIAASLPSSITLTKLEIAEQNKKLERDEKKYVFDYKTIIIDGQAPNGKIVNDWLLTLKLEKFVSDAEIIKYKLEESNQFSSFSIKLTINN